MNLIQKTILGLQRLGLRNSLRIVNFTLYKHRLDRKYSRPSQSNGPTVLPGSLLSVDQAESGARFTFENAALEVRFLAEDLARLSWEPGLPPVPYALNRTDWPPVNVELRSSRQGWSLSTQTLSLEIHSGGEIEFYGPPGRKLRSEFPPERIGENWAHHAYLDEDTRLYGLGERAARLNLRPGTFRMWNRDPVSDRGDVEKLDPLYLSIPVYMALSPASSYLVFYENSFPSSFTFDGSQASADFEGGMLRYYLIPGPPQRSLERYTELTGRAPLSPCWALGYHQSRWGYRNAQDIREVAAGFRERDMPLSAIHLDIDYMDGYRVFTVDPQRFPDLAALSDDLAGEGIRLVTIVDPGVKVDPGYFLYREGLEKNYFCTLPDGKPALGCVWAGWSAFPDFTDPVVRNWWSSQYPRLLDAGVAGFWHDMNEPATIAADGDPTLPLATRHRLEGRGGSHPEAHNLYGLTMNAAGYDGMRRAYPDRRPWLLTRSGWAGVQRYAWTWTGDSDSSWDDLRSTIPTILGLGLSGVPYSGADIGGFRGDPPAELYLRWFQMAAFLPFFRTHSAVEYARREPWIYGEPYTSILAETLRLRFCLLPYLYTLAWEAQETGQPLVRPLFWDDPTNPALLEVDDAFLLGHHLLVAPILEPGANAREVVLPSGIWYDYWSNVSYTGPGVVRLEALLERIPLLVRSGSVVPVDEDGELVLHIYAGSGESQLYSDAGDGYGPYRLDRFHLQMEGRSLRLDWVSQGEFPFPFMHVRLHLDGCQPRQAWLDGEEISLGENLKVPAPFRTFRARID